MSVLQSFQCNEGVENVVILYLKIAAPMILAYYCIFYFVFELYLNICAEVTKFGDRQYYMVMHYIGILEYYNLWRVWQIMEYDYS